MRISDWSSDVCSVEEGLAILFLDQIVENRNHDGLKIGDALDVQNALAEVDDLFDDGCLELENGEAGRMIAVPLGFLPLQLLLKYVTSLRILHLVGLQKAGGLAPPATRPLL